MALSTNNCYGQPLYVDAPEVTPLRFGLFSVAEIIEPSDPHWMQGVHYEPEAGCTLAGIYACPTCTENDNESNELKTYDNGVSEVESHPFTVYGSFSCSPVGNWDRARERALQSLFNGEERAVENEVALGTNHSSVSLVGSAVDITPNPGTAVTGDQALGLLEQYMAENNAGVGAIWMSRRDVTIINSDTKLIYQDGKILRTCLGTPVVAMAGFDGYTGPDTTGANEAWAFVTGRPTIRRSQPFVVGPRENSLDTDNNDLEILAERTYEVSWPCVTAGILITSVTA